MRALIERLVARGVAYVAEDHVLFSPSAMDALPGAPRYGSLARRSLDEMLAGARVDVAPYKRDPMDFVLWKPSKPKEPSWPSPAGIAAPGRPGWHIECSAMSMAKLLEPFGGGLACDDPGAQRVRHPRRRHRPRLPPSRERDRPVLLRLRLDAHGQFWMHNGFLQVEGEKMSKSLGNFVTIRELLATASFGGRAWPGEVLRLAMLRTHYRQPIDWTVRALEESEKALDRMVRRSRATRASAPHGRPSVARRAVRRSQYARRDRRAARARNARPAAAAAVLAARAQLPNLIGLSTLRSLGRRHAPQRRTRADRRRSTWPKIRALIECRASPPPARQRTGPQSDRLRDELAALGVAVKDNKDGTTSWEFKR